MADIFVPHTSHGRHAYLGAQLTPTATDCAAFLQVRGLEKRVPPVGVEPTLGTLLGGRPLPLGYGGIAMIPRADLETLDIQINVWRFKANVSFLIHAKFGG